MKKPIVIISIFATIAAVFFACTERLPTHPLDSEYWSGKTVEPVKTFTITNAKVDELKLEWRPDEKNPEGYKLRIAKKTGTGEWNENYRTVIGTENSLLDTVRLDESYNYKITVFYDQNTSEAVLQAHNNAEETAITSLPYTKETISSIKLNWTYIQTGHDGFKIDKKVGTADWQIAFHTLPAESQTWTDTSAEINENIEYRIYAYKGNNTSAPLATPVIEAIPAPTNLSYTTLSSTSLELNWDYTMTGIDGFRIDRKVGISGTWEEDYALVGSDMKTWTDNSYDAFETYFYKVRAYYSIYNSEYSNEFQMLPIVEGMVFVPSGSFQMGQDGFAMPVHSVTLTNNFYMNKYETTNQEYCDMLNYAKSQGLVTASSSTVTNNTGNSQQLLNLGSSSCQISYNGSSFVVDNGMEKRPVVMVTWYGSAFYCNMLSRQNGLTELYNLSDWSCNHYGSSGFRLPTEAEWEYAARFNDQRTYPWGEVISTNHANYNENGFGRTVDVGSYSPNGDSQLGLSDMAGNVWEWCNDWKADYSSDAQTNPVGPTTGTNRVLRGGGWGSTSGSCRSANRGISSPGYSSNGIGFRVVILP